MKRDLYIWKETSFVCFLAASAAATYTHTHTHQKRPTHDKKRPKQMKRDLLLGLSFAAAAAATHTHTYPHIKRDLHTSKETQTDEKRPLAWPFFRRCSSSRLHTYIPTHQKRPTHVKRDPNG